MRVARRVPGRARSRGRCGRSGRGQAARFGRGRDWSRAGKDGDAGGERAAAQAFLLADEHGGVAEELEAFLDENCESFEGCVEGFTGEQDLGRYEQYQDFTRLLELRSSAALPAALPAALLAGRAATAPESFS